MEKVQANIGAVNYRTTISNGRNILLADEPASLGGNDEGLNPYELLAASLAACTSITLKMFAQRKEWDLKEVHVNVSVERDTALNETNIVREISLDGALNDEQRQRLLLVANACPIHKILTNKIHINTQLHDL